MRELFIYCSIAMAAGVAIFTVSTQHPRRMVLGGAILGILQSAFFLLVGFELLALWNLLFTIASATTLQLFSALCGTGATQAAEIERTRADWIYGIGTALTLGAIVAFGVSKIPPSILRVNELQISDFSRVLVDRFSAFSFVVGLVLFLGVVAWSTIGRPGWKKANRENVG